MPDTTPALFTVETGQRVIRATRAYERSGQQPDPRNAFNATPSSAFYAQLTGEGAAGTTPGPGNYTWTMQQVSAGSLVTDTRASDTYHSASDVSGAQGIPNGTNVVMYFAGYDTADTPNARYLFSSLPIGQTFAVILDQNGGANGAVTGGTASVSTYTYDVYNITGTKIAATLAPIAPRWMAGPVNAATDGLAYWDGSAIQLLYAFESMGSKVCSTEGG